MPPDWFNVVYRLVAKRTGKGDCYEKIVCRFGFAQCIALDPNSAGRFITWRRSHGRRRQSTDWERRSWTSGRLVPVLACVTQQNVGGVLAECEQRDPGSLSWCKVGVSGTVEFCYGASCGAAEPQFTFAELFPAGEGGAAVTGPTHRRVKGEQSRWDAAGRCSSFSVLSV